MIINKVEKCDDEQVLFDEWLLTNGLGGFSCGSFSGTPMRKYHALLIAALANPFGRTIMLNFVADSLILPDKTEIPLTELRFKDKKDVNTASLKELRFENGLPIWTYEHNGIIIEKSLLLIHRQNTLHVTYKLVSGQDSVQIKWQPYFHFRTNEQAVNSVIPDESYTVHAKDFQYEIECPNYPLLRLYNSAQAPFTLDPQDLNDVFYEIEAQRGYEFLGNLRSPGYFLLNISLKERQTVIVSTEDWNTIFALSPREAWITEKLRKKTLLKTAGQTKHSVVSAKLVFAADQFIITPNTRFDDMIRLQALGEESKTIIAGFPWFTDWGRDTMISLEGLTLTTGRHREAYSILHTFGHYIRNGLIPNMFPDGENQGIYNTADATLWFFHAINRYIEITEDEDILEFLLPKLGDIIQSHINGTLFGIKVDTDGLLIQGQNGVQLTWMDAKVGDWVVTPRRGKAVEINALWYNALKLYEKWSGKPQEIAEKCRASFNKKFWFEEGKHLYDVIEGENGDDPALRPNQLFAISLDNPVLDEDKWKPVLTTVTEQLYTPFGLRTLSPAHPDYKTHYDGDLYARDAAYHQGTVWPWLIGPYIDVLLKVNPQDYEGARNSLKGLEQYLDANCMSTLGEIFDAHPPYKARGCFAQAWSVAELLRCLVKIDKK